MKCLVVATHNPDKRDDFIDMLAPLSAHLKFIDAYTDHDVEETGTTFEANALIKARHSFQVTGLPSIADDSGLAMHQLDGEPGIYAGRYALQPDGTKNFKAAFAKLEHTLRERLNLDKNTRITPAHSATDFISCVAYVDEHYEHTFYSVLPGYFDFEKRDVPGFGYTPIFVPHITGVNTGIASGESIAEIGDAARRCISPRRVSIQKCINWMKSK